MFTGLAQNKVIVRTTEFYKSYPVVFKAFAGTVLFAAMTTGTSLRLLMANINQANLITRADRIVTDMESVVGRMNAHGERITGLPSSNYVVHRSTIDNKETETATPSISTRLDSILANMQRVDQRYEKIVSVISDNESLMKSLPAITPTAGWISSHFGHRVSPFTHQPVLHRGLDIGAETGTPIHAAASGVIEAAGFSETLGKFVVIDHGYNIKTKYAHASELKVKKGDYVKRGDEISLVGTTGRSTGPHLHYEVWVGDNAVDPNSYLLDVDYRASSVQLGFDSNAIGGDEVGIASTTKSSTKSNNNSTVQLLIKQLIAGINIFAALTLAIITFVMINVSWSRVTAIEE